MDRSVGTSFDEALRVYILGLGPDSSPIAGCHSQGRLRALNRISGQIPAQKAIEEYFERFRASGEPEPKNEEEAALLYERIGK